MNKDSYLHLLGQKDVLTRIIETTPEEDVLDRASLQKRLEDVERRIEQERVQGPQPTKVRLTFNGRPVIGTHGIFADFASKAVSGFSEAVTAVAASLSAPLAAMGPIPRREENQLLITSTALGSFGFELEEYRPNQDLISRIDEESPVCSALDRTQKVLEGTIGSDDDLADSIVETDPRAMEKIRSFLQILADNESVCAMQFKEREFRFADVGQVKKSLARISTDNLSEKEELMKGCFLGVLPMHRTFEFKVTNDGREEVISGKIASSVSNVEEINSRLNVQLEIKVLITKVGAGRPRYVMIEK